MQPVEQRIWTMIEPTLEDQGVRLVRVQLSGGESRPQLQIMIEPAEASIKNRVSVNVTQCEKASRAISALMDVEDPVDSAYTLEVSSTGLERPLVTKADFEHYAGVQMRLETNELVEGQRKFLGTLLGIDGEMIKIKPAEGGEEVEIPYILLKKAKIVLSDEEFATLMKQID